jgi:hypothetical protein
MVQHKPFHEVNIQAHVSLLFGHHHLIFSQNLLKGYEIMSNRITFQSNQALYPLTFGNKLIHKSTTEKYFHLYADVFVNLFSYQYT